MSKHAAEGSSHKEASLSNIVLAGYVIAAVMLALLWAGLHGGFF